MTLHQLVYLSLLAAASVLAFVGGRAYLRRTSAHGARWGATGTGAFVLALAAGSGATAAGFSAVGPRPATLATPPVPPVLEVISQCESGGDPRAISADGRYRGKYQFDMTTWASVGGAGDPARAGEAEQDRRALTLLDRRGLAPWPVCGRSTNALAVRTAARAPAARAPRAFD